MTNIERAEEFANNGYALGCTKLPFEASKEGFLAGLEAARKDWEWGQNSFDEHNGRSSKID